MRTASRLTAVASLLLAGCSDSLAPLEPKPPSLSIIGDLVVNSLDDVTDSDGCTATHCSLREAVETAADGETIAIGVTGTIQLAVFPIFIDKRLSIVGPGASELTVAGPTLTTAWGALIIHPDGEVRVAGLRLSGGHATYGGGVQNAGDLTLEDVVVEGNTARLGGGILNVGTLHIRRGAVRGNTAESESNAAAGGGIFNEGTVLVEGTIIEGNTVNGSTSWGGGMYNIGALEVRDARVAGNRLLGGRGRGGGIFTGGDNGSATVERTSIVGNRVTPSSDSGSGGGIMINGGSIELRDSEVSGNHVEGLFAAGGGIEAVTSAVEVENTQIRANTVHADDVFGFGSAVAGVNAAVTLRHVTVVDNEAVAASSTPSGAVQVGGPAGTLTLLNSVVTGNFEDWDVAAVLSSAIRGNVIGSTSPQVTPLDPANILFAATPGSSFADLGFTAGPMLGHVNTYVVQAGSVVVDAGVSDGCVARDVFGTARPQGPACDAGAVEYAGGGFASGGGWFDSPPGAWTADAAGTERATFSFIARPPRRGAAPEGELQFSLQNGFRIRSTAYRALLVSGAHVILEGDAVSDGGTAVEFAVTASAEPTPRLRMRISDSATGELLYDSGNRTLGGGRITVHGN